MERNVAEKAGDWMMTELARLAREIERAQHAADGAMTQANGAKSDIAAHEKLCALRYETITTKLNVLPNVFKTMDDMRKILYIGVGVWTATLGVSAIVGLVYTLFRFAHGG